jgi:galactose mutarotase-like enzyme
VTDRARRDYARGMPSIHREASRDVALGELIYLRDERAASEVTLVPARGAIVSRFDVAGRELLYLDQATLRDAAKNVRGGIPILFPSPGKLAGDSFQVGDLRGALPQHGFARNLPWQVVAEQVEPSACVRLALVSNAQTLRQYPFEFRCELEFRLERARRSIDIALHNTGSRALPFAFGFHPYFRVTDKQRARIESDARHAFDNTLKQAVAFRGFDLTLPELDLHLLDHGRPDAAIELGDGARIVVSATPEYSVWVVWTVAGKDYVCLEPWTAPGNALNTGERLLRLPAGASHSSGITIEFIGK